MINVEGDSVTIARGKVTRIQHWVAWNGELWPIIDVRVLPNGKFGAAISDPLSGAAPLEGALSYVLSGLHEKVRGPIMQAFNLEHATPADVLAIFPRHRIIEG